MNLSKALIVTLLMGFLFCVIFVLTKEQTLLPQPGEAATDFSYPDKDGNDVSLSDFVGSVVYVDVWATWCGPCRAEMPFLHDLESEYSDKNVTFIGVSAVSYTHLTLPTN